MSFKFHDDPTGDLYSGQLDSLGRGTALYAPDQWPDRPISIGNVGILHDGSFLTYLNTRHPPADVPRLSLTDDEILQGVDLVAGEYHSQHMSRHEVRVEGSINCPSDTGIRLAHYYQWCNKAGAILVLRDRSYYEAIDERSRSFQRSVDRNWPAWFQHISGRCNVPPGATLYLVYRTVKTARNWSTLVFKENMSASSFLLQGGKPSTAAISVETRKELTSSVTPLHRSAEDVGLVYTPGINDQTVFVKLRGYKRSRFRFLSPLKLRVGQHDSTKLNDSSEIDLRSASAERQLTSYPSNPEALFSHTVPTLQALMPDAANTPHPSEPLITALSDSGDTYDEHGTMWKSEVSGDKHHVLEILLDYILEQAEEEAVDISWAVACHDDIYCLLEIWGYPRAINKLPHCLKLLKPTIVTDPVSHCAQIDMESARSSSLVSTSVVKHQETQATAHDGTQNSVVKQDVSHSIQDELYFREMGFFTQSAENDIPIFIYRRSIRRHLSPGALVTANYLKQLLLGQWFQTQSTFQHETSPGKLEFYAILVATSSVPTKSLCIRVPATSVIDNHILSCSKEFHLFPSFLSHAYGLNGLLAPSRRALDAFKLCRDPLWSMAKWLNIDVLVFPSGRHTFDPPKTLSQCSTTWDTECLSMADPHVRMYLCLVAISEYLGYPTSRDLHKELEILISPMTSNTWPLGNIKLLERLRSTSAQWRENVFYLLSDSILYALGCGEAKLPRKLLNLHGRQLIHVYQASLYMMRLLCGRGSGLHPVFFRLLYRVMAAGESLPWPGKAGNKHVIRDYCYRILNMVTDRLQSDIEIDINTLISLLSAARELVSTPLRTMVDRLVFMATANSALALNLKASERSDPHASQRYRQELEELFRIMEAAIPSLVLDLLDAERKVIIEHALWKRLSPFRTSRPELISSAFESLIRSAEEHDLLPSIESANSSPESQKCRSMEGAVEET